MQGILTIGYSHFCKFWQTLVPQIVVMKPMSDLCWLGPQNSHTIMKASNLSEADKRAKLKAAVDYLTVVTLRVPFVMLSAKIVSRGIFTISGELSLSEIQSLPN